MDVVIVGSGNIAHCFSQLLQLNGHQIRQVISRQEDHARQLAEKLNTAFSTDLLDIDMNADVYLLAVNDSAIPVLDQSLRLGKRIVTHTAGAVPLEAIGHISTNTGVIYPLQTIRKESFSQQSIPLLIEASGDTVLRRLQSLAEAISENVKYMSSADRMKMHVAAVFANNFTNHLITLCKQYCEKEALDFSLLKALLTETFRRLENGNPESSQTGPALREDLQTMDRHRELLDGYPEMRQVYDLMSESIFHYYHAAGALPGENNPS